MQLFEKLDINIENCRLIGSDSQRQEQMKKDELDKHMGTKIFDYALTLENRLLELLTMDYETVDKSLSSFLRVYIYADTVMWHYYMISVIYLKYLKKEEILAYCQNILKLFILFKEPLKIIIKTEPKELLRKIQKNSINQKHFLEDIKLYPKFSLSCVRNITKFQTQIQIEKIKAQQNKA